MMAVRKKKTKPRIRTGGIEKISYKNFEYLSRFMSDRAKIYSKKQTGLSSKMQRKLTREIKRARHLGLLPFKVNI